MPLTSKLPRSAGIALMLVATVCGCAAGQKIDGQVPPDSREVTHIVVLNLESADSEPNVIKEDEAIRRILESWAFNPLEWEIYGGDHLPPTYKIQFFGGSTILATYWIGAYSSLRRFPCYSFCSGWWIAGSDADQRIIDTVYKGLGEGVYFSLFDELGVWKKWE